MKRLQSCFGCQNLIANTVCTNRLKWYNFGFQMIGEMVAYVQDSGLKAIVDCCSRFSELPDHQGSRKKWLPWWLKLRCFFKFNQKGEEIMPANNSVIIFHRSTYNSKEDLTNQRAFLRANHEILKSTRIIDYMTGDPCQARKLFEVYRNSRIFR